MAERGRKMRYGTVLFDADGTLLDFARCEHDAFKDAMALSGINVDEDMINVYSEINDSLWKKLERKEIERSVLLYHRFELFCERYGFEADSKKISADYVEALSTKPYMLDGACALLQKLCKKVRMYIVTNGFEYVQRGRYARTGIEKYFDGIFISECVGFHKPDVRFFEHVAQNIADFDKNDTLIVGDSLTSDIKGGNAFGIDTCWYDPQKKTVQGEVIPKFIAYDFDAVYRIIDGN